MGTYEYTNYGKDGFKVSRFTIQTYKGTKDVEILSELNYKIGNRYFIMPNLIRSNESLWIDPIIIDMGLFDISVVHEEE